jgi:hypothetical protein
MTKRVCATVWASLLLTCAPGESAPSQLVDRVLAVVGTEVITLSDTYLINRTLMLDDVNRYTAPEPDSKAIASGLEKLKARFPSSADFEAALARTAMTEERLRGFVRDSLRIEGAIDQRFGGAATPTEQEITRYYQEHQETFARDGRVPALEEIRAEVSERASAARREALVSDWIERLKRRTEITVLYQPARTTPDTPPGV